MNEKEREEEQKVLSKFALQISEIKRRKIIGLNYFEYWIERELKKKWKANMDNLIKIGASVNIKRTDGK